MEKLSLDWKDKKILQELDSNARQSFSKIAKNTKLSKQTVAYHVNTLMQKGVISSFISFIDIQRLGYTFYDVFFKLKYCTLEEEKEIIEKIKNMPEVGWFVSTRGEWKLVACVMAKSPIQFHEILDKILDSISEKVLEYDFFIVISASQLPYKRVYNAPIESYSEQTYLGKREDVQLSKLDLLVLGNLAKNSRISRIELSDKTGESLEKIRYSIKKLESSRIIQAYKPLIDVSKLGLSWHMLLIQFNYCSSSKRKEFIDFLKNQKEVFYTVTGVGNWSFMVEFHVKNPEELDNIQREISRFDAIIRDDRMMQITKEHKCVFFPENLIG